MRSDHTYEKVDADIDFNGGMNLASDRLAPGQYRYGKNVVVRGGKICTRPTVFRPWRITTTGAEDPFYFNEDNARDNAAGHTGFWFPWGFVGSAYLDIQGVGTMRFPTGAFTLQIIVSDNRVYVLDAGKVVVIPTVYDLNGETVRLVKTETHLVMFRLGDKPPMKWDGGAAGFVAFTSAGETNRIPYGVDGVYAAGRLWVLDQDERTVFASDILDIDSYEFVYQQFGARLETGDTVQRMVEFHNDTLLLFGKRSIAAIAGINSPVNLADGITLSSVVAQSKVSTTVGAVGREAVVIHGEQISFISYRGITSIGRTAQDSLLGRELPMSAAIRPIFDTINLNAASIACCGYHDSYLLFAVPTQDNTINDTILVYDLLAAGGNGAWVSAWDGDLLNPSVFYEVDDKLLYIASDGAVRQMFGNSDTDSLDAVADVHVFEMSEVVEVGDLRRWRTGGVVTGAWIVYRSVTNHTTTDPSELATAATWTAVTNPQGLFAVESEVWFRWYDHGDPTVPKHNSRAEILVEHIGPNITLKLEAKELNTLTTLFDDITYDRTAYEVDNLAAWVSSNVSLDWWTKGREDYEVVVPSAGLYINPTIGIDVNAYTQHRIPFIPRSLDNLRWSVRLYCDQGRMKVRHLVSKAVEGAFSKRDVA